MDQEFKFGDIRCLQVFQNSFYVLANRTNNKLGTYVLEIPFELDKKIGTDHMEFQYVFKSRHDLMIDDANIDFKAITDKDQQPEKSEIIISYKMIYENIYNIIVVQKKGCKFDTMFKFQGYQLWESKVKGFLSNANHDFIILNKEGTKFMKIDANKLRKPFKRKD